MAERAEIKVFLRSFAATLAVLLLVPLGVVLACIKHLPPPSLSANTSFNAKAQWLRSSLADGRCDVLVLGSSMALNSFSYPAFSRKTSDKVVNLASWGMSMGDDYRMLRVVTSHCKPRLLIFPVYYGDFSSKEQAIDWDAFSRYVKGDNAAPIYLRTLDLISLVDEAGRLRKHRKLGRRTYASLEFDNSGTVNLSAENFHVVQKRWEGYKYHPVATASQKSLDELRQIVSLAKSLGVSIVVATVPMREAAAQFLDAAALDNLWSVAEKIVTMGGGRFIRINNDQRFPDDWFADYAHLNERGASVWTELVIERSQDLIAGTLSMSQSIASAEARLSREGR